MSALISYFRESIKELKLVTWPKQEELLQLTIINIVFVSIAMVILALVDFGLSYGYQLLLGLSESGAA